MDVNGESMTIESDQLKEDAQQAILDSEAENDRKQEQENSNKMEDTINHNKACTVQGGRRRLVK